jgi:putative Mg2+ transporter-C (MgtC) family protein
MLVSIYGFSDVLKLGHVTLDPSRVAAQIVSGIGFIGGGIIFVKRDSVRGLTTAAGVWVTSGVGMACGGNLPLVASCATVIYFLVAFGYPWLVDRLPPSKRAPSDLRLVYIGGRGVLRDALSECSRHGFSISDVSICGEENGSGNGAGSREVTVELELRGAGSLSGLAADLHHMSGVIDVRAGGEREVSG